MTILEKLKLLNFKECESSYYSRKRFIFNKGDISYEFLMWSYGSYMLTKYHSNGFLEFKTDISAILFLENEFKNDFISIINNIIYEKIIKKKFFNMKYYNFREFISKYRDG